MVFKHTQFPPWLNIHIMLYIFSCIIENSNYGCNKHFLIRLKFHSILSIAVLKEKNNNKSKSKNHNYPNVCNRAWKIRLDYQICDKGFRSHYNLGPGKFDTAEAIRDPIFRGRSQLLRKLWDIKSVFIWNIRHQPASRNLERDKNGLRVLGPRYLELIWSQIRAGFGDPRPISV